MQQKFMMIDRLSPVISHRQVGSAYVKKTKALGINEAHARMGPLKIRVWFDVRH